MREFIKYLIFNLFFFCWVTSATRYKGTISSEFGINKNFTFNLLFLCWATAATKNKIYFGGKSNKNVIK